jgi:hypothetical protein
MAKSSTPTHRLSLDLPEPIFLDLKLMAVQQKVSMRTFAIEAIVSKINRVRKTSGGK